MNHTDTTATPSTTARLGLILFAAVSVWLSAPGGIASLALLSLLWPLPLALALHRVSVFKSALIAGGFGFLLWLHAVWWLLPAIVEFTGVSMLLALPLYALVCLLCAVPYMLFGALLAYYRWLEAATAWQQLPNALLASAAFSVILFWSPSLIPGQPLHSLYQLPLLIQLLDIGGLPLLGFAIGCLQWLLALALINRKRSGWPVLPLTAAAATAAIIIGYGALKLQHYEQPQGGKTLRIAALQPNLQRADSIHWLYQQSAQALAADPTIDLLLWPEFPPAYSLIESEHHRQRTLALTAQHNAAMLVVSGYVYSDTTKQHYYNAAQLIKNQRILGQYEKQILVPFFEYLPFEQQLSPLRQWFPDTLRYVPGNKTQPLKLTIDNDDINIITAICYEIIFPRQIKPMVSNGGELLINPVSDSWFGDTNASAHHFSLALFRTVEHRLPMVRVANSGISAFIKASGEIVPGSTTELMTQAVHVFDLTIPPQRSVYSRIGDSFVYTLSGLLAIFASLRFYRQRRCR